MKWNKPENEEGEWEHIFKEIVTGIIWVVIVLLIYGYVATNKLP